MKANVGFIIKDSKEFWEGKDITKLIKSMPRGNVIEHLEDPNSDMHLMISCPESFAELLYKDNGYLIGWIADYGTFDEYDGFYWDGKVLQVLHKDEWISMKKWEKIAERLCDE